MGMLHFIGQYCHATGRRMSEALLELLVDLFLTIRGFSYASAWVEKYKTASAKTLQKSRGI